MTKNQKTKIKINNFKEVKRNVSVFEFNEISKIQKEKECSRGEAHEFLKNKIETNQE